MDAKHTPAPWTLLEHEHEPCELVGNGTIQIAHIFCTDFPTGEADALLIAAAPELLAALQTLAAYANGRLGKNPYCIPEYKQALVAIGKAQGKRVDNDYWMDANNSADRAEFTKRGQQ